MLAGRYELLEELGRGGMGVVWRAGDRLRGREVAVKEVRVPDRLSQPEVEQLYARLEREGRATARIQHHNILTVHDVVTAEGRPWIVMELIRGRSLAQSLRADGPLVPRRAAAIGAEVLSALRAAHAAGVVHRDVKPGNVLIANDGRVVLSDFGIALVRGASSLTLMGELMGSPEYLAPERAAGRRPGPASDLWSLGVTLYTAVEGRSPFHRDTAVSTLRAVVDQPLPPPSRSGPLTGVLEGLLCKAPEQRLTARQAEQMLRIVASGGVPGRATPPRPAVRRTTSLTAEDIQHENAAADDGGTRGGTPPNAAPPRTSPAAPPHGAPDAVPYPPTPQPSRRRAVGEPRAAGPVDGDVPPAAGGAPRAGARGSGGRRGEPAGGRYRHRDGGGDGDGSPTERPSPFLRRLARYLSLRGPGRSR